MHLIALLLLILTPAFAAAPAAPTLAGRLALEAIPSFEIVASDTDAERANYTVRAPNGVAAVVETVEQHLLASGWASHPNITEPPPEAGSAQVVSFVQESDLLELRASRPGEGDLVTLQLSLVSLGSPEQLAGAP